MVACIGDLGLRELQYRVAIAALIARRNQGVEGQRVVLGRGLLLLEQTTEQADLHPVELTGHPFDHRASVALALIR